MPLGVAPYIIAEGGTNHASRAPVDRVINALAIVRAAAMCRADAVKFQLFRAGEDLFCPMDGDDRRWRRWEKTLLTDSDWDLIHRTCEDLKIDLILSAFQPSGVELINELGITHKVASRAAGKYPYDMMKGESIGSNGFHEPLTHYILQCNPTYPAPMEAWRCLETDGISDHSGTVWPAIDALAREENPIIEVHFRPVGLDPGPDAPVELTTSQLKLICEARDALTEMRQG